MAINTNHVTDELTTTSGSLKVNGRDLNALTKSDVGLGNVDNTSDESKPVSTAQAVALASKQDTLVSGTNLKTINGESILGGGDLVVGGGGSGGSGTGASGGGNGGFGGGGGACAYGATSITGNGGYGGGGAGGPFSSATTGSPGTGGAAAVIIIY